MEEDVEGNDSLGPDLTEGHRRDGKGPHGWPAAAGGERLGQGRRGKKRKLGFFPSRPVP